MNIPGSGSPLPSPGVGSPSGSRFSLGALIQRRPRANTVNGVGSGPSSPGVAGREEYFPHIASLNQSPRNRSRSRPTEDTNGSHSRSNSASSPIGSPLNLNSSSFGQSFFPSDSNPATPIDQIDDPLSTPLAEEQVQPSTSSTNSNRSYQVRLVPHLAVSLRSLHFEPVNRELKATGSGIRIGRYNDRGPHIGPNDLKTPRVAFKSKVVSRSHAEITVDHSGNFWVKDTKSSSGTFLNHIRLSGPGLESRLFQVKDGDVLQLGVDYQGGTEEMYRCVKMKVELNRAFQRAANQFNMNAMKQLRALAPATPSNTDSTRAPKADSSTHTDCCICLFAVTVCQALFIAPCSHVYHFKCIRPLITLHHPGFSCPLCRTFADLEADVETDEDHEKEDAVMAADKSDSEEDPGEEEEEELVTTDPTSPFRTPVRPSTSSRRSSTHSRAQTPIAAEVPDVYDIRRASISISGPRGEAFSIPITGRTSRPSSVRNLDMSTRTLSPMTSSAGLREQPTSSQMSQASTAIDSRLSDSDLEALPTAIRIPGTSTNLEERMALDDDTLFLSAQTPANSSFLSTVPSRSSH